MSGRNRSAHVGDRHQWDRDPEHVTAHVLHLLQKCTRSLRVGEVLMQRRRARARDVDHDFGRVDKHRGIARRDVGRRGELRRVENDREDVLRTEGQDEAGETRRHCRSWWRNTWWTQILGNEVEEGGANGHDEAVASFRI